MGKGKRARDSGGLFKVKGSRYWWISYESNFGYRRESSGTEVKADAKAMLDKRREAARNRTLLDPKQQVKVDDLIQLVLDEYQQNGQEVGNPRRHWELHLKPVFGGMLADNVTSDMVRAYIRQRSEEGLENSTINRHLSTLRLAFNLGCECDPPKVMRPLKVKNLTEPEAREGFFSECEYDAMCVATSELWLRTMLALGFTWGLRKGEILKLRVRQLDFADGMIHLEARQTKNKTRRDAPMTRELRQLLRQCCHGKTADDYLITRSGERVRDFRDAWHKLCVACELGKFYCRACERQVGADMKCDGCGELSHDKLRYEGRFFHDFRRTGVRNMVRRGIPEKVAMLISGHKTRSVFERYNITDTADLEDAREKMDKPFTVPVQEPELEAVRIN